MFHEIEVKEKKIVLNYSFNVICNQIFKRQFQLMELEEAANLNEWTNDTSSSQGRGSMILVFTTSTLQTLHVYSTLKRLGNVCFHIVSTWNTRGVFVGHKVETILVTMASSNGIRCNICLFHQSLLHICFVYIALWYALQRDEKSHLH